MLLLGSLFARAEDETEDEGVVEDEGADSAVPDEEVVEEPGKKNVSPDVDATLFFTKPTVNPAGVELPGGQIAEFLIGFSNKGDQEFIIDSLDASFRYPMDFNYHIQNFSTINYQRVVRPKEEATVAYSFIPADAFAGRPIGLTVNLAYRDASGNFFFDPIFNETVQITEFDEGFDTEVFFMYVFIAAGLLLVLFLVVSLVQGKTKGKKPAPAARTKAVETGTAGDEVDYEWIPRSALRTPGGGNSNKTSPRQRKGRRAGAASSDEE